MFWKSLIHSQKLSGEGGGRGVGQGEPGEKRRGRGEGRGGPAEKKRAGRGRRWGQLREEERGEGGKESSTAVKVARYYEKHCYEDQHPLSELFLSGRKTSYSVLPSEH